MQMLQRVVVESDVVKHFGFSKSRKDDAETRTKTPPTALFGTFWCSLFLSVLA